MARKSAKGIAEKNGGEKAGGAPEPPEAIAAPDAAGASARESESPSHLRGLGVYGFDAVEPLILAALVSEDPLLLIGKAGTGKTYLLNSLSEALGLEHRHYNASLISFDDLVGFPYPRPDRSGIEYLSTPATAWAAESLLVDELNRCKTEHQNRFFSLIHERRLQGVRLEKLRYRWAAINPVTPDQSEGEVYSGVEALDPALADRFSFLIEVPDWRELDEADQRLVADPAGEGRTSTDTSGLRNRLKAWREEFRWRIEALPEGLIEYTRLVTTALGEGGWRISPRRARLIARNILAVLIVTGGRDLDRHCHLALRWSLPQRASGQALDETRIRAIHRAAWNAVYGSREEKWIAGFHATNSLAAKARLLRAGAPDKDVASIAVSQFLSTGFVDEVSAFALAVYGAVLEKRIEIGAEGLHEISRIAEPLLELKGATRDKERLAAGEKVLARLPRARAERARQLFHGLILKGVQTRDYAALEKEFNSCVRVFQRRRR